jgi:hypothetical protein
MISTRDKVTMILHLALAIVATLKVMITTRKLVLRSKMKRTSMKLFRTSTVRMPAMTV